MGELLLVYGGSGSGKSAWAERELLARARGRAVYLAAMEPSGSGGTAPCGRATAGWRGDSL